MAAGAGFWPLAACRELDDAILHLRFNEPEIGTWVLRTERRPEPPCWPPTTCSASTATTGWSGRSSCSGAARSSGLDLSARTLVALVEPGSCFAGTLAELALAADRSFMLDGTFEDSDVPPAALVLTDANVGWYPMANGLTRLATRFWGHPTPSDGGRAALGKELLAAEAADLGLVTFTPDDLDWDDEVRLLLEERASFSPDALTGMEANYRFVGPETMETKIFGRLTAWQNWIFQRPNAAGPDGALRRYGTGSRPAYRPEASLTMTTIDYGDRIPNNVDLADDRRLQRALESWQPKFLEWWRELGPVAFQDHDVYLRTAVAVGQEGWANFDYVKMPDYRWGIFLADPEPDRRIAFGDHLGEPVWQEVPGEHRSDLRRLIVVQGDTEPASVEQQRHLCQTAPEPLRPAQPVPGQRRGGPPPVGDGVPAAPLLRPGRPRRGRRAARAPLRRRRQPPHPRRLQRADARLAVVLLLHLLHRPRRQVPAGVAARERLRPAVAHLRLHAEGGGPPHVRRRHRHRPGGAAHRRAHEGARHRRRPAATAASTSPPSSATSTSTTACRSTCSAPRPPPTRPTTSPPG